MEKISYTREEFYSIYRTWQQSGRSKKSFCQEQGIIYSSFLYWAKKFAVEETREEGSFVELDLPGLAPSSVEVEIEYPSGIKLRLFRQVGSGWIRELLGS